MKIINKGGQIEIVFPNCPKFFIVSKWEKYNKIYFLCERHKSRRKGKRPQGDNCQLLYALKNSDGLSVTKETREKLFRYIEQCVTHQFPNFFPFDTLIVVPSKHNIGYDLAKIISRIYRVNLITGYLEKNSPQNALDDISRAPHIKQNIKDALRRAIQRDRNNLSLKSIQPMHREYVPMLIAKNTWLPIYSKNVLIIDDICASGSTLKLAKNLIEKHSPQVEKIAALTLFGKLKK